MAHSKLAVARCLRERALAMLYIRVEVQLLALWPSDIIWRLNVGLVNKHRTSGCSDFQEAVEDLF
jgi:hypothetical protein